MTERRPISPDDAAEDAILEAEGFMQEAERLRAAWDEVDPKTAWRIADLMDRSARVLESVPPLRDFEDTWREVADIDRRRAKAWRLAAAALSDEADNLGDAVDRYRRSAIALLSDTQLWLRLKELRDQALMKSGASAGEGRPE